jgi:hypothetical protein
MPTKTKTKRSRDYELYATHRGGGFTTASIAYSRGTHRWTYTVRAVSIKQAYYLAANEQFATDERSVGIRKIERDWWHGSANGPEDARRRGELVEAPYLRRKA